MGFWESRTGEVVSGKPEDAYQPQFEIIPHGTLAPAQIKVFKLTSKEFEGKSSDFYEITWRITEGPFKSREVSQKIKTFDEKPEIAQRALNMLKLIYDLCGHKPSHADTPTDIDHRSLINRTLGIKIGEWQMPKKNGPGFMEGNNVTEVHALDSNFVAEVGVKRELPTTRSSAVESAFSRNTGTPELGDDIPF